MPPESPGVTAASGSTTNAVSPPPCAARSSTRMPCRTASRPTTNRPMRRAAEKSMTGGFASRQLACSSSSVDMPTPLSVICSMQPPPLSICPETVTLVCSEENAVAFSTSSASRWTRSLTTGPATAMSP
ncbi:Uncharacterised protein [Mycobacterium tuberculosis]|nr:Uncharacterised protein [Mycobacterium tuberculosis]